MIDLEKDTHPNSNSNVKEKGEALFEEFLPFVNLEGIDDETSAHFMDFLRDFYDKTHELWEPGGCRSIEWMESKAKGSRNQHLRGARIDLMNWAAGGHFWLKATFGEHQLVIDPTGVWVRGDYYKDNGGILPYFGLITEAPDKHLRIYENSDTGSHHIFHP